MSPIFSAQELHSIVGGKLFENDWSLIIVSKLSKKYSPIALPHNTCNLWAS